MLDLVQGVFEGAAQLNLAIGVVDFEMYIGALVKVSLAWFHRNHVKVKLEDLKEVQYEAQCPSFIDTLMIVPISSEGKNDVILIPIMSCMRWSTCTWQL